MLYFIKRLIKIGLARRGISLVLAYVLLLVLSSIMIMLVEPVDSGLSHFDQALWWSIVTSTTVGYGDLFPASNAGKIVAVLLPMLLGIGLGAAFITHVASVLIERRDKKMHGEKDYSGQDHILMVGSTNETGQLLDEIQRDESYADQDIVVLADIERHPFPEMENIFFIKGRPDTISSLNKANISKAQNIVIHTGSDEESLFALINTLKLKKDSCRVTVRCISTQSLDTFSSVPGNFHVIMQMTAEMMVQAMQDKVHLPLQVLLRNNDDDEIYFVLVPDLKKQPLTWWPLHDSFKTRYNYLTFALLTRDKQVVVNPDIDHTIAKGDGIWLMASKRPVNIEWPV